jgi:hypothetical protein
MVSEYWLAAHGSMHVNAKKVEMDEYLGFVNWDENMQWCV